MQRQVQACVLVFLWTPRAPRVRKTGLPTALLLRHSQKWWVCGPACSSSVPGSICLSSHQDHTVLITWALPRLCKGSGASSPGPRFPPVAAWACLHPRCLHISLGTGLSFPARPARSLVGAELLAVQGGPRGSGTEFPTCAGLPFRCSDTWRLTLAFPPGCPCRCSRRWTRCWPTGASTSSPPRRSECSLCSVFSAASVVQPRAHLAENH